MPITTSGTFTTNGDGTGTWSLANGESGTFSLLDYKVNSDGSVSYRQRFKRSNGSIYGEVQGILRGDPANNSGRYSGTWTLTEKNGSYTYSNFRNGVLISTGSFQPTTTPTYTITPSATSINEGQILTTNIATTGVAAGTTLYWSLSGTSINANDFSSGALTGSGSVAANGSLSFSHTLANDLTTEGNETLNINLFTDAKRTQRVGNTASVTVVDTSRNPTSTPTPDPITGQITFSDLGTVVSDRVYSKDSRWLQPIVNNTPFTQQDMDRLTNFNIEFEFNNQYIVATAVVRGDTRQPISQYMGRDWTARMVLRGNFSYSGGRLTSASIDSGAVQLISQSTPNSIGSGQLISITPNIGISSAPVSDPTSWSSFRRVTSFGDSPLANIRGLGYSPLSPENTTATINALQGFGGGRRFFYSGWETNPFNSNLI